MLTKLILAGWGSGVLAVTAAGVVLVAQGGDWAPAQPSASVASTSAAKTADKENEPPGKSLIVTGIITGRVAPGLPAVLTVTVQNPNNQDLLLKTVAGQVTSVTSGPNGLLAACDKSWFSIGSFSGSQTVARNASTSLQLPVSLANISAVNQDNCKGATYNFSFTASATSK
jgi:hypothetical protein